MSKHMTGGGQATVGSSGDGLSIEQIKMFGKILAVLGTVFLFAFRGWRKRREKSPKVCKTIEVSIGATFALLLVLFQMANWAGTPVDDIAYTACRNVVVRVNRPLAGFEASGGHFQDASALAKAGIICPAGGTFTIENGRVLCSKHKQ